MKGKVATELWMEDGEMLAAVAVDGIDGLHTHVEAEDEIVEIEAEAQAVADGHLLPE